MIYFLLPIVFFHAGPSISINLYMFFPMEMTTLSWSLSLEMTSSSDLPSLRQLSISPLPTHFILFPYKVDIVVHPNL